MDIAFRTIYLRKRFPLAISRGTSDGSDNLFVSVTHDRVSGWGEMAPGIRTGAETAASGQAALTEFLAEIARVQAGVHAGKAGAGKAGTGRAGAAFHGGPGELAIAEIHERGRESQVPPCALAALDIALWDWTARKAGMPLYQLLGLPKPSAPTSVTIGINPPEVVRERIPLLLDDSGIRALKIKLGSPDGIEADQAMFSQVVESARNYAVSLRVDANGGWDVDQALVMMKWLAQRDVEYVEQPLDEGREGDLPVLYKNRPLPIFVDESCRFADDIPNWAHAVDGVNLKLMKCGGITGALRIIAVAGAFNLKTMVGCMSESSMSISAAAALSGALDYIDLDSHLNLHPDPCNGAQLMDGIVMPNEAPGHGAAFV